MKRIVSLLAVVSVLSSVAYAGEEPPTSSEVCIGIPPPPPMPEEMNLDSWDFGSNALLPTTSSTQSLYLVAFESPVDPTRLYVYGIDVVDNRILFAGSASKRLAEDIAVRAAIDISRFQTSGATHAGKGGSLLEIEGPIPPPPPPNIHDWGIRNYGFYAWQKAYVMHEATW